jgi:16S rRNA (guanine527-N7)-methyltransferase
MESVRRYAQFLATEGAVRGLIGPREATRIWERHILNCAAIADLIPQSASLIDIGSGAGLPGLVVALHRPDLTVHLVEPLARRVEFLREAIELLELPHVRVHRARAEELAGALEAEVVTARAVAPLSALVEWAWPLIVPGGRLVAMKGARAADELAEAQPILARVGCTEARVTALDGVTVVEARRPAG